MTDYTKDFVKFFNSKLGKVNAWEAWKSIINASACAIANTVEQNPTRYAKREEEYAICEKTLGKDTLGDHIYRFDPDNGLRIAE